MRIVLIGPVPPYRGGIAQYTAQLHQALAESDDRFTISFSRQFPAFMYPGGSDKEPEPRAYLPDVEYIVDSVNPFTWPAVGRRIRSLNPDLIVVQWWHVYWAPFIIWVKRLARRCGKRLVVICHNVDDHESAGWKVKLRNLALGDCKELFVHSSRHRESLGEMFPAASIRMHPIPAYDAFPAPDHELPRRARTELLFFGLIRPYKGLDILLHALARIADRDFHLTIAGESWDGVSAYERIISESGISEKVDMVNAYVSNQSAANLFARADAIVLPYRSASGSAVAALAFNYHKPVVASEVGGFVDTVLPGTGILVEAENVDALAGALSRVMDGGKWYEPDAIAATNERLTWRSLASELKRR
ncbi:MAG: glycosyltransferase [Mesorhizobium sp.]|uniref:glycosyltransferase n=1 Tax=unclassified Mesorhizobium TaxID=325217 RepID=UPI000FCBF7BA|nr:MULTISPECIES: glycosyltransferase [unclassified Mesorhizobium]RUX43913.1 glycosyltransferase [Mesorhizobium sp. M4A.F.Ca.ET.050.02.1.1]RVD33991.1 glycosyltransferase [Mesorhizobium sp. M4A.F.Ca.ET.020.02.1.1]RWC19536.1 MAG: glycosyltransferase [Mesorhizobium sp.]RWD04093.1 MAG: glycosyltransferase [Mesorhizobium sp.]RWD30450.1 MAG: glycosyltransferase [Mesorhizobium sp.]